MAMKSSQQSLEEKVDELPESLKQKIDDLTDSVNTRLDKLDSSRDVTEVIGQKRVEEKVDTLIDTVSKQKTYDHKLHDCVQEAVKSKLEEDQEELEEIKRRRTCVIIHGLKESFEHESEARKAEDESSIIDLLHIIKCDSVSASDVIRLGKESEDQNVKLRPIKLVLASEEQKEKVLRQAKNLKGKTEGWDKVYIHQDLTPKQRQKRNMLLKELKTRKAQGEENLLIRNGKIVNRRVYESQTASN
jgi:hypothetical protein